ncbi:hypothetical protein [Kutzneria sp. 744]|uniref:P-type ATPase n=1 Tax=Kutzneria sp. (strain 744) TaxID=345341 RepID=UPI0004B2122E|nr:hypothetical protein [Kutzneria sp. 744]
MIVMFVLGLSRGQAWDTLFVSAVALAIAAIPEALPTVTQTILSLGGVDLAKRNAIIHPALFDGQRRDARRRKGRR